MPMYVVRLSSASEDRPDLVGQLVGFFYAPDAPRLSAMVDEVVDPADCEYCSLQHGGIVWHGEAPDADGLGIFTDEETTKADLKDGGEISLSEQWLFKFVDGLSWKPLGKAKDSYANRITELAKRHV